MEELDGVMEKCVTGSDQNNNTRAGLLKYS